MIPIPLRHFFVIYQQFEYRFYLYFVLLNFKVHEKFTFILSLSFSLNFFFFLSGLHSHVFLYRFLYLTHVGQNIGKCIP